MQLYSSRFDLAPYSFHMIFCCIALAKKYFKHIRAVSHTVDDTLVEVITQRLKSCRGQVYMALLASLTLVLNLDCNSFAVACAHVVHLTADGGIVGVRTTAKLFVSACEPKLRKLRLSNLICILKDDHS